nr:Bax inhibitor-1 family protein [Photobacterium kishitanii]
MGLVIIYGVVISSVVAEAVPSDYISTHKVTASILFLVISLCGIGVTNLSKKPLIQLIGFTAVAAPFGLIFSGVGLVVSHEVIVQAMFLTVVVAVASTTAGMIYPAVFLSLGRALLLSIVILLISQVLNAAFGLGFGGWLAVLSSFIFSLFIAHDFVRSQAVEPTVSNAVSSGAGLFIDIANLFLDFVTQGSDDWL